MMATLELERTGPLPQSAPWNGAAGSEFGYGGICWGTIPSRSDAKESIMPLCPGVGFLTAGLSRFCTYGARHAEGQGRSDRS